MSTSIEKGSWVGLLYLEELKLNQTRETLKHSLSISDKYVTGQPHNITVNNIMLYGTE